MDKQDEMDHLRRNLEGYKPRNPEKIKSRAEVLKNDEILFQERNLIVYAFAENIFPLSKKEMSQHYEWTEEEKGEEHIPPRE